MSLKKTIVITGGPGTGKTSLINALERQGYFCFHEVIRSMTLEAKKELKEDSSASNPLDFVKDPMAFNSLLLKGRTKQFFDAKKQKESLLFFDRGIPDVLAYMDYFKQEYGPNFINNCQKNKYSQVFILPPWKDIYVRDNERLESFEEAEEIYTHLEKTYLHFGYQPIKVPTGTVTERVEFIKTIIEKS